MASTAPPDVFVSYNKADLAWAEWVAWELEEEGYSVVVQAWDFRPGGNFVLYMQEATRARHTLAVLSPSYLAAEYTQAEWEQGQRQAMAAEIDAPPRGRRPPGVDALPPRHRRPRRRPRLSLDRARDLVRACGYGGREREVAWLERRLGGG